MIEPDRITDKPIKMMATIEQKAIQLAEQLNQSGLSVTTAESCTGGWVAVAITSVPGSSAWFDRSFVTYSNTAKQEMIGVRRSTLDQFGAVSEETAREMAQGALAHSHAQLSVAITGIAGPDGGSKEKPVGTVWIAWGITHADKKKIITKLKLFSGDRHSIREQAVIEALQGLLEISSGS